jgi:hypothetical protein
LVPTNPRRSERLDSNNNILTENLPN